MLYAHPGYGAGLEEASGGQEDEAIDAVRAAFHCRSDSIYEQGRATQTVSDLQSNTLSFGSRMHAGQPAWR